MPGIHPRQLWNNHAGDGSRVDRGRVSVTVTCAIRLARLGRLLSVGAAENGLTIRAQNGSDIKYVSVFGVGEIDRGVAGNTTDDAVRRINCGWRAIAAEDDATRRSEADKVNLLAGG